MAKYLLLCLEVGVWANGILPDFAKNVMPYTIDSYICFLNLSKTNLCDDKLKKQSFYIRQQSTKLLEKVRETLQTTWLCPKIVNKLNSDKYSTCLYTLCWSFKPSSTQLEHLVNIAEGRNSILDYDKRPKFDPLSEFGFRLRCPVILCFSVNNLCNLQTVVNKYIDFQGMKKKTLIKQLNCKYSPALACRKSIGCFKNVVSVIPCRFQANNAELLFNRYIVN